MRAKMVADGIAELTDDELLACSKQMNEWLEKSVYASNRATHSWFNLFKEVDDDGSGFITHDELHDVIRHKLKQNKASMSDERITQLWCALDADDSNQLMPDEMGKWLRRGAITKSPAKKADLKKTELGMGQVRRRQTASPLSSLAPYASRSRSMLSTHKPPPS